VCVEQGTRHDREVGFRDEGANRSARAGAWLSVLDRWVEPLSELLEAMIVPSLICIYGIGAAINGHLSQKTERFLPSRGGNGPEISYTGEDGTKIGNTLK